MFFKSNNPIKIYHVLWVNSPNTEEQLGDAAGIFPVKRLQKAISILRNNPGTAKTCPAVMST